MPLGAKTVLAANLILQRFDFLADELDDGAAPVAHHVIVVTAPMDVLEERMALVEVMLVNQARLGEVIQRAVQRGATDALPLAAQVRQKLLGVEVPFVAQDTVEDLEPFGRDAQVTRTQMLAQVFLGAGRARVGWACRRGHRNLLALGAIRCN